MPDAEKRTDLTRYTRWTERDDGTLIADILGSRFAITVRPTEGTVILNGQPLSPDEARLIGTRLIEGATRADADRAVRKMGL